MNLPRRIFNLPNGITIGRFFLSAVLMVLLMFEQTTPVAAAAWLAFIIAAVTDWLDGWLARRWQSVTVLGKLMDPLADKVLVTTALVMLIPLGRIPAWLVLMILVRELVVTGLRGVASSRGIVVAASWLGKWKSTVQYIGLGFLIFPAGLLPFIPEWLILKTGLLIMYAALVLTIWSGFDYFYKLRRIFLEEDA